MPVEFGPNRNVVEFRHDGKPAQDELPKEWQPTGSWGVIDLDRDGLLNERDWNFFASVEPRKTASLRFGWSAKGM